MELTSVDGTTNKTLDGLEAEVMRRLALYMVQKAIFCPVNGEVLDIGTVVAIFNAAGDDIIAVISPAGWDKRKAALAEWVAPNMVWHRV